MMTMPNSRFLCENRIKKNLPIQQNEVGQNEQALVPIENVMPLGNVSPKIEAAMQEEVICSNLLIYIQFKKKFQEDLMNSSYATIELNSSSSSIIVLNDNYNKALNLDNSVEILENDENVPPPDLEPPKKKQKINE